MELTVVPIVKPDDANFIFGQSHFIKTVEDLHEALVGAVPRVRLRAHLVWEEASGVANCWCAGRVMTKPHSAMRCRWRTAGRVRIADPGWQLHPADLNGDGLTDLFLLNARGSTWRR